MSGYTPRTAYVNVLRTIKANVVAMIDQWGTWQATQVFDDQSPSLIRRRKRTKEELPENDPEALIRLAQFMDAIALDADVLAQAARERAASLQ